MTIFSINYCTSGVRVINYDNENDYIVVRCYKVPLNECIRFGTMWG